MIILTSEQINTLFQLFESLNTVSEFNNVAEFELELLNTIQYENLKTYKDIENYIVINS